MMMLGSPAPTQTNHFLPPPTISTTVSYPEILGISSLLHQCRCLDEFKQVHAQFIKFGLSYAAQHAGILLKGCALSDWGSIDYAIKIFEGISDRGSFEYNTMIRGYAINAVSKPKAAMVLYGEMVEEVVRPDCYTFPFVLKACAQSGVVDLGKQVHGHVLKFGFGTDIYVQNSLINMYGMCGAIKDSHSVFYGIGEMKDVVSWSAIIAAHSRNGLWSDCLELFFQMRDGGWEADESTLVSVLSSCAHLGKLDLGMCIHCSYMRKFCKDNVIMETSLIEMYVKCGQLHSANQIFRSMTYKNAWTYSVMISGLSMHGEEQKALLLFSDMVAEGLLPDETVYVGVLTACCRSGLVNEGLQYFNRMRCEHRIEPTIKHYCCIVDLLGRAGELRKAYEFIETMPNKPNYIVWRSLLNACKIHKNFELAEVVGRRLLLLDTQNAGDYLILSHIYADVGQWEEAAKFRTQMVGRGVSQVRGFSGVEVGKELHTFVSQDMSHRRSKEIYEMLHQMEWQLRFEGYHCDTSRVMFPVDEEEKKRLLKAHSLKLAIAFGLISTSRGEVLRVVRNLRMCVDCHTYTKLISKIYAREVVVKERNRFHHFKNGVCSCKDYW